MRKLFCLALLVGLLALRGAGWAQDNPPAAPAAPATPLASSEASPNYVLRPGDELVVTFLGVQDPPYDVKLREDGGMYIPRVGDVHAAGHTIAELKPLLEERLAKHLLHSQVEIGLRQTAPQFAMVFGEVLKPGQIQVAEDTTLVQALSEAGGFNPGADASEVTLVRNKQTLHVLLENSGDPPVVAPGDVIYVGKAGKVSVMGAVNTPAIITINGASSTVWEAIMQAGGPKPEAAMSRIKLVRFGATTAADAQGRLLDLSEGPASKDGQLPVANGDSITVPEQRVLFVSVGQGGKTASLPIQGPTNLLDVLVAAGVGDRQTLSKVAIIRAKDVAKLGPGTLNPVAAQGLTHPKAPPDLNTPPGPAASGTPAAPTTTATPVSSPVVSKTPAVSPSTPPVAGGRPDDPLTMGSDRPAKGADTPTATADKGAPDNVQVIDVASALKHGTTGQLTTVSDGDVVVVNPPNPNGGMNSWLQWGNLLNWIFYLRYL